MDSRFDFPDGTLSTEHQVLVETLNEFLDTLADDEHQKVAMRLGMELLELANVASQEKIARAAGYSERTLRFYKQRLHGEGLDGLFDHPIPGRPAISTQPTVEGRVMQAILEAVISQHTLPDDESLAEVVNAQLLEQKDPLAGQVTASIVETIRLRWGIQRLPVLQQLQEALATCGFDVVPMSGGSVGVRTVPASLASSQVEPRSSAKLRCSAPRLPEPSGDRQG